MKYLDNSGLAKVIEKLRNEIKANSNEKIIIGTSFTSFGDGETKTMQELTNAFFGDTTHTPQELIDTLKRIWNEGIPAYFQNNNTLVHRNYPVTVMHLNPTKYYFIYFDGNSGSIKNIYIPYLSADATATATISKKTMDIRVNDNLTNTSTTTPLSANQGKVLNDKIEAMKPVNSLISDSTEASLAAAAGKILNDKIEEQKPVYFPMEFWVSKDNMTGQEMVNLFYGDETHTIEQFRNELLRAKSTEKNNVPVFVYQKNTASQRTIAPVSFLGGRRSTSLGSIQYLIYTDNNGIHISSFTIPSTAEETCWISAGSYDYRAIDNLTSTSTTQGLSANQGRILNEKIENLPYEKIISEEYTATTNSNFVWDETNKDYTTTYPESTTGNYDSSLVIKPNKSISKLIIDITSNLQSTALVSITKGTETLKETLTSEQLIIENLTSSDSIDITVRMTTAGESFKVKMITIEEDLSTDKFLSVTKQTEPFIPTEDWQPVTKKYVDEKEMKTYRVSKDFFQESERGTVTKTAQEWVNAWFGDEIHTIEDFLNVLEELNNKEVKLLFVGSNRLSFINYIISKRTKPKVMYNNFWMYIIYANNILSFQMLSSWSASTTATTNISANINMTPISLSLQVRDENYNYSYPTFTTSKIENMYNEQSFILNGAYVNGGIIYGNTDENRGILFIKIKNSSSLYFSSTYIQNNNSNPFTIYQFDKDLNFVKNFTTSYIYGNDNNTSFYVSPNTTSNGYIGFAYTSEEQIENFTARQGHRHITELKTKSTKENFKTTENNGMVINNLDIKISKEDQTEGDMWIKKGIKNIFDKKQVTLNYYRDSSSNSSGPILSFNLNKFCVKANLKAKHFYYVDSKYATFDGYSVKMSNGTFTQSSTPLKVFMWGDDKEIYFNFTKDTTHTIEEQLDNIVITEDFTLDNYNVDTELYLKNDKDEYYPVANLSDIKRTKNYIQDIQNGTVNPIGVYTWNGVGDADGLKIWKDAFETSKTKNAVIIVADKNDKYDSKDGIFIIPKGMGDTITSSNKTLYGNSLTAQTAYLSGIYGDTIRKYYLTVQITWSTVQKCPSSISNVTRVNNDLPSYLSTRDNEFADVFQPTQDYHPATKKYVDDKVSPIDFNKVYELSWATNESDTSKNGYIMPIEGLTSLEQIRDKRIPFIAKVMDDYVGTSYGLSLTSTPQGSTGTAATLYAPIDSESITLSTPGKVNYITFTNKNGTDCFVIDNDRKDLTLSLYFMTSTTTSYTTIDSVLTNLGIGTELELAAFLNALEYRPIPVTFKGRLSTSDGYGSFNGSISGTVARASGKIRKMELTMYAHTKIYNALVTVNTSDSTVTVERKVIDLAELAGVLGGSY